jgi:hypothetical protein
MPDAAWQMAAPRLAVIGSIGGSVSSVARSALESQLNETVAAAAPADWLSAAEALNAIATIRVLPTPLFTMSPPWNLPCLPPTYRPLSRDAPVAAPARGRLGY